MTAGASLQAFFDYVNYMCLCKFAESGNAELSWKDMHKWAMLDLTFQASFIFGFFVAAFPFCLCARRGARAS